ncbi:MAG: hypothetical protein DME80_04490 [Verrucomicrobia bacterium]|nr:MAG: hypothetical protein DME80_04490 [Verrucomicrobiota bacterium]
MIAVTFALPAESSEFLRRLGNKFCTDRNGTRIIRGTVDDREIEVLHTGVGEKVCRQQVEKFLKDQQFEFLISAGFAGALNDQLHSGDLLRARNFSTLDLTERQSFPSLPIHQADLLMRSEMKSRTRQTQPRWTWKRNLLRAPAPNMAFHCSRCASLPIRLMNHFLRHRRSCSTSNASELIW